jgi:hypothetical protein
LSPSIEICSVLQRIKSQSSPWTNLKLAQILVATRKLLHAVEYLQNGQKFVDMSVAKLPQLVDDELLPSKETLVGGDDGGEDAVSDKLEESVVEEGSSDEDDEDDEDERMVVAAGESNGVSETVPAVKRPPDVARVKTSLCSYFRKRGCRHGDNCVYAHGESELQQRPDGTWDPTSERAKNGVAVEKMESVSGGAAAPEQAGQFQKCLVHVPRGWSQIKLKSFLDEHVSGSPVDVLMTNFYSVSHVH